MPPLFSIISPVYNCQAKLEKTIQSVLSQSFVDFEYLILDGGSNDGTKESLSRIQDGRVQYFSEPDQGVYDAMNKGIARAQGRFLYFLGAGDEMLPDALLKITHHLPSGDLALIYGNVLMPDGRAYNGEFSNLKICRKNISHQAIFYGRGVFSAVGKYDLRFKAFADWALNIRCFGDRRITKRYVPTLIASYERGGISDFGDAVFSSERRSLILGSFGLLTYVIFSLRSTLTSLLIRWPGLQGKLSRPVILDD